MSGNVSVSPYNPVQQAGVRAKNPPDLVIAFRAPSSANGKDYGYFPGTLWLYVNNSFWGLLGRTISPTTKSGNWSQLGTSGSGVTSVLGTTSQITVVTAAGVATVSLPAAIITPGSLATTTTLASGTTLTAGTGLTVTTGGATITAGGLTVTAGGAAITGTTTINTTGAATTTIGTGGTGAVSIGNTTGNTAVTGSLTASTTLTASAGAITATNGNLVLGTVGNFISIKSGTTGFAGTGTLDSGTVTIANTNIAAGDIIIPTRTGANGSTTLGVLTYTISPATSFTVTSLILGTPASTQTADTSTFAYVIIRPT